MDFLNPESAFMQMLGKLADIIIVNLLFFLCSIPLVTIGAATVAAHKVMQDIVFMTERNIWKRFFHTFKSSFKQATISWAFVLILVFFLVLDFYLVAQYCQGILAMILFLFLGMMSLSVLGAAGFLFPLLARYKSSLRQQIKNACFLAWGKPCRSIAVLVFGLVPVVLPLFSVRFFFEKNYLWFLFFFGLSFYFISLLLKPVFVRIETPVNT